MSDAPFLSGQLLLSMPGIGDPRFERAVIAMCLHDGDGALGLVINQPGELSLRELMAHLGLDPGQTPDVPVLVGGPVEPGRGFVLHDCDYQAQGTIQIGDRWALTTTQDVLKAIAEGQGPRRYQAMLGYTGWGPGQLDDELTRHGWHIAPGDADIVFDLAPADRWSTAFGRQGIAVGALSTEAGRA